MSVDSRELRALASKIVYVLLTKNAIAPTPIPVTELTTMLSIWDRDVVRDALEYLVNQPTSPVEYADNEHEYIQLTDRQRALSYYNERRTVE